MISKYSETIDYFLKCTKERSEELINSGHEIARPMSILPYKENGDIKYSFVCPIEDEREYLYNALEFLEDTTDIVENKEGKVFEELKKSQKLLHAKLIKLLKECRGILKETTYIAQFCSSMVEVEHVITLGKSMQNDDESEAREIVIRLLKEALETMERVQRKSKS